MAVQYSILTDVEFDTSQIQKKLNSAAKKIEGIELDVKGGEKIDQLSSSMEATSLTFQAANEIFSKTIDIISSMVEQVYNLDSALTEFRKVSELSGPALDDYTVKLADMGKQVARTGKPKCQAPNVGMINQHYEPLEIQYSLRALKTTA